MARFDDQVINTLSVAGRITDLPPRQRRWFTPIESGRGLQPGETAGEPIRIPQRDANRLLKGLARFVADIPAGSSPHVVWERGQDELSVDTQSIGLACKPRLLLVSLTVSCDQVAKPVRVSVPFGTGRAVSPRGLLMSTFTRVAAPPVLADSWSDAIVAFCWEALLELSRRVSAEVGVDRSGKPLIPAGLAAEEGFLIVQPVARHDLARISG